MTCECAVGCQVIDSCKEQNIKCLHGGTCVQGLKNVAVCHCVKPWHGLTCDEGGVESPTDDFAKNCTIAANSLSQSLNPPDTTAGKIGVAGACYTDQINAAHTKECDAKCKQEIDHTLATCPEAARTKDINQSIQLVATAGPLGCVAAVPSLKEAVCNFRAVRSSLESTGCLSFTDAEQQPVSDWDLVHFVHGQYPLNRSIGRDSNLHAIPIFWDIDPLSGHCNTKCVQAVQRLNQQCSANDAQAGTDAGDANALLVTIGRSQVTFCDNVDVDASGDVSPADVCEYYKSSNLPGACCPDGGMTSCNFKGNDIIATCGNPGCKGAVLQGAQEGICPGIFTSTNSKQATGMRALFRSAVHTAFSPLPPHTYQNSLTCCLVLSSSDISQAAAIQVLWRRCKNHQGLHRHQGRARRPASCCSAQAVQRAGVGAGGDGRRLVGDAGVHRGGLHQAESNRAGRSLGVVSSPDVPPPPPPAAPPPAPRLRPQLPVAPVIWAGQPRHRPTAATTNCGCCCTWQLL